LFRLNRSDEAERFARESLAARSDVGPLYDVLLNYYILKNRSADAEALLKSKIKALPRDSSSVLQLAALYQRMHREAEMTETLKSLVDARKQFPDGHALVGDFYASLRRWSEAQGEYSAGLKAASRKDKILYQKKIVKALVGEGKRGDAVEKLDQLLKTDPSDAESRIARAILLRESNDPKRLDFAISELNAVVGQDPSNQVVRYNLGLAYLSKGDLQGARAQLSESARLNRSAVAPRVALGELAMRMRNYPEAIRLADEVLALDQSNSTAKLWRVAGLLGSKAYGQARTELDGLLREYPDSLNVNLHAAVLDAAEKKYNAAELRYLRFYKPGQQDLRPLEGLVQLYTEQRQADRGLKLIDNELKQSPDSTPLHLLLASTAIKAGKLDLAAEQYEWLRSKDPNSELAYSSLGDVYQLKGDVNNALKSYEKAREFAPNDPRIIAIIAYLQQTTPGQNSEAIVNLRKELALDPENTVAMNNLAFALADTGNDLDQALSLAEKAQKKAPGNGGIADTLGWVYTKKGLNDSAIQIFIGLVRKYPDDPTVRYHYAVALLQKGQTDEAKAEFVISLSKNPPKDMADKIKQILSKVG
jgi:tetratricopeptide (TPR) repeat protein